MPSKKLLFFMFLSSFFIMSADEGVLPNHKNNTTKSEGDNPKETQKKKEIKISIDDIIFSTKHHYPLIRAAFEDVRAAESKMLSFEGQFDAKIKGKGDQRTEGYYDGEYYDVSIVKPIPYLNAELYSGFRESEGDFPVYEGKSVTLDGGEVRMGLSLSLLRNRDIDSRRFDIEQSRLKVLSKEFKAKSVELKMIKEATVAYWTYIAKREIYKVYKNLLEISLKRDEALTQKIKQGDVAQIYGVENKQYIATRRNQLIQAELDMNHAKLVLSLFYRNNEGDIISLNDAVFITEFSEPNEVNSLNWMEDYKSSLKNLPSLMMLENEIKLADVKREMGENDLSPELNLRVENTRDQGSGSKTLKGVENRIYLNLEIPIERRKGRGKVREAEFTKNKLNFDKTLLKDMLKNEINSHYLSLVAQSKAIGNSKVEVNLARQLQEAEDIKFTQGASDFFLLNIREQNTAYAEVKLIKAELKYQKSLAKYRLSTLFYLK